MFGTASAEMEVKVAASAAWELYGSIQLAKIVATDPSSKVEIIQGDGGVGTIVQITLPGMSPFKEIFKKVDNEKRVKETEVIEGGYLDLGYTLFRIRLEIIDGGKEEQQKEGEGSCSCITKATIEYEIKEEAAPNASFASIDPLVAVMKIAAEYLLANQNKNNLIAN